MLNSCCKSYKPRSLGAWGRNFRVLPPVPEGGRREGTPTSQLGGGGGGRVGVPAPCAAPRPLPPLPHPTASSTTHRRLLLWLPLGVGCRFEWGAEKHTSVSSKGPACPPSLVTPVLSGAETTSPELENLPWETGKSGGKTTATEKQKRPGRCLALVCWILACFLCSRCEENDRKEKKP